MDRILKAQNKEYKGFLNLVQLYDMFKRLHEAKIVRQTPIIVILGFELQVHYLGYGGFLGGSSRLPNLDEIERRRTEPIYVYNPKKRKRR